jgi:murein DD-endopeptidase MepM/ murein hydrolase activator NlpD
MGTMRSRLTLLACLVAVALTGVAAPAAGATNGGGAAAPRADTTAAPSGGTQVGQRPAARRKAARRRAAQRRAKRRRAASPPATAIPTEESPHYFPVLGTYTLGGPDSRFGAKRRGHSHQGQDIAAAEGVPVVAPWAGMVEYVRYQASGAGWYIVIDGDGEDRDYVFMHLRKGSILVAAGQHVSAGQPIAQVGNTGSSSGPHLHFEVWVGGWYDGGEPVDPLPLLQQWAA